MLNHIKSSILFFLILFSLSYAVFNVSSFLYPGENSGDLSFTNFSFSNNNYSLVSLNQRSLFLLKNDQPVQDFNDINFTLLSYFRNTYYPGQGDLDALRQTIVTYNLSRNLGGRYPGQAEYACRQILLLNGIRYGNTTYYCDTDDNCRKITAIFYSAQYTEGVRQSIPIEETLRLLKEFATASYETDRLIARSLYLVDNINNQNINGSFSELNSIVPILRKDKYLLENTRFRFPSSDPNDVKKCNNDRCFGICPDITFNNSALDGMDQNIAFLYNRSQLFINSRSIGFDIYNSTLSRFSYRESGTKAVKLSSLFKPLAVNAGNVLAEGNSALAHISNETLRADLNKISDLTIKINTSLIMLNVSSTEDDLQQYENLINNAKKLIPDVVELYNQSVNAKTNADALILILDTKDINAQDRKSLDDLKNATYSLDASFSDGLTSDQFSQIATTYKNVSQQANTILKNQKEGPISLPASKFRSFARKVNTGISNFLSTSQMMPSVDFTSNKLFSFGAVTLFIFLSFSSILFFIFIKLYPGFSNKGFSKFVFIGLFAITLVGLLIFSSFLYVFLNKTASAADLEEFTYDLSFKKSAAVAIDLKGANNDAIGNMRSCANLIAGNLMSNNKSISVYELKSDNTCSVTLPSGQTTTKERGKCNAELKNSPALIISFSSVPVKPALSIIYNTKAFIGGDASYYKHCTISTVFK